MIQLSNTFQSIGVGTLIGHCKLPLICGEKSSLESGFNQTVGKIKWVSVEFVQKWAVDGQQGLLLCCCLDVS